MDKGNACDTVSIVVPVYNTETYLEKCIESILAQNYQKTELILVDDGSTDGSAAICDAYAKRHGKVHVVRQKNMGLAFARMAGVHAAAGRYIMFVDSDDYIENDLAETIMNRVLAERESVDLAVSYLLYEEGERRIRSDVYIQDGLYRKESVLNCLIDNDITGGTGMPVSMCGKIFARDKLEMAFKRVQKRLAYGEDLAELLFFMEEAENILFVSKWGYHYVNRKGSMSRSVSADYFREIKELYDYMQTECRENQSDPEIWRQSTNFIRYLLVETMQEIFPDIDMGFIPFVPPYERIPKGCRLAVYGAGRVGKSMVKCLLHSRFAEVAGWFDRNGGTSLYAIEIEPPEKIRETEFDYILIAVAIKDYVSQIKQQLESMGVPKEKIIWERPYCG